MIDSELLLQGYRLGVFPMAMEDDSIAWFSPDPRAIIPLDDFHVPHALQRVARKNIFEIKIDNRFGEVIRACARRKDTWINREIIESYERLHELGWTVWRCRRRRVFWRINVSPGDRRVEDRAGRVGRTLARAQIHIT